MGRKPTGANVWDEAIERVVKVMEEGHRLVVSMSGGKDSTVCFELCRIGMEMVPSYRERYGALDVVMRDEEIMFPGTFEYCERIREYEEVNFHWLIARQPVINAFNRECPYWWVFDDRHEDLWVRQPPDYAEWIPDQNIEAMVSPERFPPAEGKTLMDVMGLRVEESRGRLFGLYASKGYITKPRPNGVRKVRPIYDWTDADVWRAIGENRWDYNKAYDTLFRRKVPRKKLRIAPPTMNAAGIPLLKPASQAWPVWFDRVAKRCPGVRTAAQYGMAAVTPERHAGETWEEVFKRNCLGLEPSDHMTLPDGTRRPLGPWVECAANRPPDWIKARAQKVHDRIVHQHQRHSTVPLPENRACWQCTGDVGSWKNMSWYLYLGDPFCVKTGSILKPVEPEFFREGAGTWGGTPAFA